MSAVAELDRPLGPYEPRPALPERPSAAEYARHRWFMLGQALRLTVVACDEERGVLRDQHGGLSELTVAARDAILRFL